MSLNVKSGVEKKDTSQARHSLRRVALVEEDRATLHLNDKQ